MPSLIVVVDLDLDLNFNFNFKCRCDRGCGWKPPLFFPSPPFTYQSLQPDAYRIPRMEKVGLIATMKKSPVVSTRFKKTKLFLSTP